MAAVYAATGDLAEAEDAVQEAYARAWQRWDRLTAEGDPTPWVRTVALRLAVSSWRRARNRMRAHFRHGPPPDLPDLAPDRVALIHALRGLKPCVSVSLWRLDPTATASPGPYGSNPEEAKRRC